MKLGVPVAAVVLGGIVPGEFAATARPGPGEPQGQKMPPGQRKKNRFLGAHPIAAAPGGGYCYIDVPHVHDYPPDRGTLYEQVGEDYVFTGDPVPFGYDGDKTVFYGMHPVPIAPAVAPAVAVAGPGTFCFLKGPHYHDYPAPAQPGYKQKDGVVFYVGPVTPEIARVRPERERALEVEYLPYVAQRPQVVVTPPPEWQGQVWVPPPPGAVVVAAAPAPVVVQAPPPAVVVAAPQPAVVVAPPGPPAIIVAPPGPPAVIIAPPGPRGVVFVGGHPGKHKGWGKRGRWR